MKFADFLRGVVTVVETDVAKVFDVARSAVAAAPFLPQNIKADLAQLLNDSQADLLGLAGLGGTLAGSMAADAVDDLTTLLANTASNLSSGKSLDQLSAAEKTLLAQTWTAMKVQGDTLITQAQAGLKVIGGGSDAAQAQALS